MKKFFCNGKQAICEIEGYHICDECEYLSNNGGRYVEVPEYHKLKVMLDPGAKIPTRAHKKDAGLDLYAMKDQDVPAFGSAVFDTGVHVAIPEGYVGDVKSKSGLMMNNDITTDGTVDCEYTGAIRVKLFNHSMTAYHVKAGQKIAQLVIKAIITPEPEVVDSMEATERGEGGFGSTGKF